MQVSLYHTLKDSAPAVFALLLMIITNTDMDSFAADVLEASRSKPVLVDFWAQWCAPCLVIAPVLEKVVADLAGTISLVKLEVDKGENMKLAGQFKVRGFPTVILFQDANDMARFSGARSATQIRAFLSKHLDVADANRQQVQ